MQEKQWKSICAMPELERQKNPSLENYQGSLVGAAIGDALGKFREQLTKSKADDLYGYVTAFVEPREGSFCIDLKGHQHTDDTDLILLLGESIVDNQKLDPANICKRLMHWYDDPTSRRRYLGQATVGAIDAIKKLGIQNWWCSGANGNGCGAATRVIPVSLAFLDNEFWLNFWCTIGSIITHRNPLAVDGAQIVAMALRSLAFGNLPSVQNLTMAASTSEFRDKLETVSKLLSDKSTTEEAIGFLGSGVEAHHVVSLSLFIFLSNPNVFQCVIDGANANDEKGGDTDSVACLVGAMFGLYKGVKSLPQELVTAVENSQRLTKLADALFNFRIKNKSLLPF